jgi:hypothetical protein
MVEKGGTSLSLVPSGNNLDDVLYHFASLFLMDEALEAAASICMA